MLERTLELAVDAVQLPDGTEGHMDLGARLLAVTARAVRNADVHHPKLVFLDVPHDLRRDRRALHGGQLVGEELEALALEQLEAAVDVERLVLDDRPREQLPGMADELPRPVVGTFDPEADGDIRVGGERFVQELADFLGSELPVGIAEPDPVVTHGQAGLEAGLEGSAVSEVPDVGLGPHLVTVEAFEALADRGRVVLAAVVDDDDDELVPLLVQVVDGFAYHEGQVLRLVPGRQEERDAGLC